MQYISKIEGSWGDHRPYWNYLDSVKGQMPAHLHEFASNPENHNLKSPNSLHDSWLEYWNITEPSQSQKRSNRSLQIDACLLGPSHDRHIYLTYKGVSNYSVQNQSAIGAIAKGHQDLLVHELLMVQNDLFSHELIFSRGTVFFVQFSDLEHRIELIS